MQFLYKATKINVCYMIIIKGSPLRAIQLKKRTHKLFSGTESVTESKG